MTKKRFMLPSSIKFLNFGLRLCWPRSNWRY
uniref:Uncharacterized protein n=1 Tax=Rhizophora mucronata TaxID=61149 RepID=A0A2P2N2Q1_RHIMU